MVPLKRDPWMGRFGVVLYFHILWVMQEISLKCSLNTGFFLIVNLFIFI